MATTGLPTVVSDAYEFLKWLVDHVGKFPRSHRFVLGERIETAMLDLVMLLVEAAYQREAKKRLLQQANVELEKVRLLIRLGKDLGFTSLRQYEHACVQVTGIGRQIGGWVRFEASS